VTPLSEWVALSSDDLPTIDRIANLIHPTLPERIEVLAEKSALYPEGCMKLSRKGETLGYAFAHPWKTGDIPFLDTFLHALPDSADCLYLHDIALLPEARGSDASGRYLQLLVHLAKQGGLSQLACVSVYGSYVLWQRHGFQIVSRPSLADNLTVYGAEAHYMEMTVT
jgi:hypothetical protein